MKKEAIRHVVRDASDDRVVASDVHHRQIVVKCEIDRMSIQAEIEPGLSNGGIGELYIVDGGDLLERARDSGVVSDNGLDSIVLDNLIDGTDLVVSLDHKRGTNEISREL